MYNMLIFTIGSLHDDVTLVKPRPFEVSLHPGDTIENVLLFVIASSTSGHNFCSMSGIPI